MTNRKIVAGVLTGLAAGVAIALVLSSKKNRNAVRKLEAKVKDPVEDLKGKFNEFIDHMAHKVQGILK